MASSREVTSDMRILENWNNDNMQEFLLTSLSSNKEYLKLAQMKCLRNEKALIQFLGFLEKAFPRSDLSLFVHKDKDHYIEFINSAGMDFFDIIAAADIEDGASIVQRGPSEFASLCQLALQQKPDAQCVRLLYHQNAAYIQYQTEPEVRMESISAVHSKRNLRYAVLGLTSLIFLGCAATWEKRASKAIGLLMILIVVALSKHRMSGEAGSED